MLAQRMASLCNRLLFRHRLIQFKSVEVVLFEDAAFVFEEEVGSGWSYQGRVAPFSVEETWLVF